jgi:Domain of Unknown Function (DUF1259)
LIKLPNCRLAGVQPSGSGKVAIAGDFVLTGDEVNPVVLAWRAYGIDMTAPATDGVLSNQGRTQKSSFVFKRHGRGGGCGAPLRTI